MNPEKVISALLGGDPALASLVGARIYPVIAPKGADLGDCYLVWRKISDINQTAVAQNSSFVMKKARVQIECKSKEYPGQKLLMQAVNRACHLKNGLIAGVQVVSCMQILEGPEGHDSKAGYFEQPVDFQIFYHDSGV